ncbi:MAG: ABC transporter ATP-binding protein, partial [Rhodospirillales bacterium]|nr:ABC transporter ATP-binding protein [Rhodospirillales bacterium]
YPHMLSGGQRQRVMIAMALALEPALLIADEPTTALDVTTQMQILRLIKEIQTRRGTGVLFITHDFGVVAEIADRVAVMQTGRIVEAGPAQAVLNAPQHPYTRALIAAVPHQAAARPAITGRPVLEAVGVRKTYRRGGGLFGGGATIQAVADADFVLRKGETLGLVGESGSGKSTLARCVVRLVHPEDGAIRFHDTDLARLNRRAWKPMRKRIQMVFQDPFASLNPRQTIYRLLDTPLRVHGLRDRRERQQRITDIVTRVGLSPDALRLYPHEFSGGQRQRIGIARALILRPDLVVCDEPVSALDLSIQAQILNLLADLKRDLSLSYLFISHDLAVVQYFADRVLVMFGGRIVESADHHALWHTPRHPYTKILLQAVPRANHPRREPAEPATARAAAPTESGTGCRFRHRCPAAIARCATEDPTLRRVAANHLAACHLA